MDVLIQTSVKQQIIAMKAIGVPVAHLYVQSIIKNFAKKAAG